MIAYRPFLMLSVALGLSACSGPQVRTVGTGGGAPAYELRGSSLDAIHAEAARLCGKGYAVLREAQQFAPTQPDDSGATQWIQQAGFWLEGSPGNRAQATVQCRV
jgi:hypothetical protein